MLQPGNETCPPRPAAGLGVALEMREHNFMREERGPFKGGRAVGVRTAPKFMLTVGQADETGVTELANQLPTIVLGKDVF